MKIIVWYWEDFPAYVANNCAVDMGFVCYEDKVWIEEGRPFVVSFSSSQPHDLISYLDDAFFEKKKVVCEGDMGDIDLSP